MFGCQRSCLSKADDAGARRVKLCYDKRTYGTQSLQFPKTKALQRSGALVVFNDAEFSDEDFKAIQNVGDSEKKGTWGKTGRFGVGFRAVYHITDVPSLVSGSRIVFFDPHCKFVQPGLPGKGVSFAGGTSSQVPSIDKYNDQYCPYEMFGCDMRTHFTGTLLRLPLRSEQQAAADSQKLSTKPYTADKMKALFDGGDFAVPAERGADRAAHMGA
eukprot:COSAG02_NODE_12403_length_1552_cov_1.109429_1_plen_215_part_00